MQYSLKRSPLKMTIEYCVTKDICKVFIGSYKMVGTCYFRCIDQPSPRDQHTQVQMVPFLDLSDEVLHMDTV